MGWSLQNDARGQSIDFSYDWLFLLHDFFEDSGMAMPFVFEVDGVVTITAQIAELLRSRARKLKAESTFEVLSEEVLAELDDGGDPRHGQYFQDLRWYEMLAFFKVVEEGDEIHYSL